ncbi:MAG: Hsp20/alpha crystallin family protein [Solobacterium sp.]|nr:Hsp20/alpha crystallin family protein [Solobacterium sp.]
MVYIPVKRNSVFDDLIDDVFGTPGFTSGSSLMKTDIREKDGMYLLDIDLPGFRKEDIRISLYNGNLTVTAEHNKTEEEKSAEGRIIRQERYMGSCSRTWYVGDAIKDTDIKAGFKDGILTLEVPSEKKKEAEEKKFINIL